MKRPAGQPRKVEFYKHSLGPQEFQQVQRVLKGVFLTAGPETAAFEREAAQFLGVAHSVGVTSCTSALHLALVALGIGPGDEVITTPMSYVATANAILHAGATPVFVDVEFATGNLDVGKVKAAVTPRTKAILPVHLYGHMCDMRALAALASQLGLHVIEDAAHCFEGSRDGVRPGQLGTLACFSFYATKNITSGEGGLIAGNDPDLMARVKRLRNHGIDKPVSERHSGTYVHWSQVDLGFKANMNDIQAAMLRPQLERVEALRQQRHQIVQRYNAALADVPGITLHKVLESTQSAHHLYTVLVPAPQRDAVLTALQADGVGVAVNYRPIHLMPYYRAHMGFREGMFPVAESIGAATVTLPLYPKLKIADQNWVIHALKEAVK